MWFEHGTTNTEDLWPTKARPTPGQGIVRLDNDIRFLSYATNGAV